MSFTSKLGTSLSKLGNFKLGSIGTSGPATYDNTISLDCTASVTRTALGDFIEDLTVAGIASADGSDGGPLFVSLSLQVTASFFSPGGVVYFNNQAIEGVASTSELAGFGYSDTLSIDATASVDNVFLYNQRLSISLDAIASTTIAHDFVALNHVILTSVDSIARAVIEDYGVTLLLNSRATIYVEGLYDSLEALVINTTMVASGELSTPSETPDAIAGIAVVANAVFNRTVNQTFAMTQVLYKSPGLVPAVQTLSMTQSTSHRMVHNQAVVQTLTYTQLAYRVYPVYQTLVYSQTAVGIRVHVQRVTQTFSMTQNALYHGVFNRSITQTYRPFQGGTEELPIIGVPAIYNPPVVVFKLPPKCFVLLQSSKYSLTLPCPQLGDGQDYSGALNLKRTMTGDTFTYVRRSKLNTLRYTFWLGRQKTLEVEKFVVSYGDQLLSLHNWKGEHWKVHITSTPFEFVGKERYQPQGERYEINFEFTGIKVGG